MKVKLIISLLVALYVQQDWAGSVKYETVLKNKTLQEQKDLISSQIADILCSLEHFPQYKELDSRELTLEVLKNHSSSEQLSGFISEAKKLGSNAEQISPGCKQIPKSYIADLTALIEERYGKDYLDAVSRDDALLNEVLVRTLRQQIEKEVSSFEVLVDEDAISRARRNGFIVSFVLAAFLLILGRPLTLFFYYFITSKDQAKTFAELLQQVKDSWQKTISAASVDKQSEQGEK